MWKKLAQNPLKKSQLNGKQLQKRQYARKHDMANEIEKEIVKQAIKEWLNEKVAQFGWFSIRTIFYVFVAGLGYAYLVTHGWSLPK
jgi:hypothetical protein